MTNDPDGPFDYYGHALNQTRNSDHPDREALAALHAEIAEALELAMMKVDRVKTADFIPEALKIVQQSVSRGAAAGNYGLSGLVIECRVDPRDGSRLLLSICGPGGLLIQACSTLTNRR